MKPSYQPIAAPSFKALSIKTVTAFVRLASRVATTFVGQHKNGFNVVFNKFGFGKHECTHCVRMSQYENAIGQWDPGNRAGELCVR